MNQLMAVPVLHGTDVGIQNTYIQKGEGKWEKRRVYLHYY